MATMADVLKANEAVFPEQAVALIFTLHGIRAKPKAMSVIDLVHMYPQLAGFINAENGAYYRGLSNASSCIGLRDGTVYICIDVRPQSKARIKLGLYEVFWGIDQPKKPNNFETFNSFTALEQAFQGNAIKTALRFSPEINQVEATWLFLNRLLRYLATRGRVSQKRQLALQALLQQQRAALEKLHQARSERKSKKARQASQ